MTTDTITSWLKEPAVLPDNPAVDATLREWPWFVPGRLMEAVREHQHIPFSTRALATLQLYSESWLPAYGLLIQENAVVTTPATSYEASEHIIHDEVEEIPVADEEPIAQAEELVEDTDKPFIQPLYTEDYFRYEGVAVSHEEGETPAEPAQIYEQSQTLMVVMSFAEWLNHFKVKTQKEQEEAKEKSALRSMWQQEKLAAALEDEPEEIPEDVFEMAVSSITREDDIVSEPLAQIYERQEKWSAAAEMYRKLALKYPAKSTYFASRAEAAKKRLL